MEQVSHMVAGLTFVVAAMAPVAAQAGDLVETAVCAAEAETPTTQSPAPPEMEES